MIVLERYDHMRAESSALNLVPMRGQPASEVLVEGSALLRAGASVRRAMPTRPNGSRQTIKPPAVTICAF